MLLFPLFLLSFSLPENNWKHQCNHTIPPNHTPLFHGNTHSPPKNIQNPHLPVENHLRSPSFPSRCPAKTKKGATAQAISESCQLFTKASSRAAERRLLRRVENLKGKAVVGEFFEGFLQVFSDFSDFLWSFSFRDFYAVFLRPGLVQRLFNGGFQKGLGKTKQSPAEKNAALKLLPSTSVFRSKGRW